MKFDSLDAIVDFAIDKEKEAVEFYSGLARDEAFSGNKDMFTDFAKEEHKHQKLLQDFKLKGFTQAMREYRLKWVKDIKRSDYVVEIEYRKGMESRLTLRRARSFSKCSARRKPSTSSPWRRCTTTTWRRWGIK